VISRLQTALNAAGYDAGSADGIMGKRTMDAVKRYQRDNNLPSGQLTLGVLEKLNVSL
jgi:peptidoglycan hydrolase-like protein with peptidoglycan-binding domain